MLGSGEAIQSLIIPLDSESIVLPNAAVAEVVFFTEVAPIDNVPPWFLGMLSWRNLRLPLISFEAAATDGEAPKAHHKQKYAILKALGHDPNFQFFAIRTEGIPQLVRIDKATISPSPDLGETSEYILRHVLVNEVSAIIPDLDFVEENIKKVMATL